MLFYIYTSADKIFTMFHLECLLIIESIHTDIKYTLNVMLVHISDVVMLNRDDINLLDCIIIDYLPEQGIHK